MAEKKRWKCPSWSFHTGDPPHVHDLFVPRTAGVDDRRSSWPHESPIQPSSQAQTPAVQTPFREQSSGQDVPAAETASGSKTVAKNAHTPAARVSVHRLGGFIRSGFTDLTKKKSPAGGAARACAHCCEAFLPLRSGFTDKKKVSLGGRGGACVCVCVCACVCACMRLCSGCACLSLLMLVRQSLRKTRQLQRSQL